MCGIYFYKGNDVHKLLPQLLLASDSIKQRGPEKTTIIYSDSYFISFHRLSINNISNECSQPYMYHYDDYTYYVMCNGEIYNWKNLVNVYNLNQAQIKNDSAVIFPLFQMLKYDVNKLSNNLNGEFAFVIIQIDNQTDKVNNVWSGTDTCSVRPLFYFNDKMTNTYILSSLLKGISLLDSYIDLTDKVYRFSSGTTYHYQYLSFQGKYEFVEQLYSNLLDKNSNYFIKLNNLETSETEYYKRIVDTFTKCVVKRIEKDNTSRDIGCLLSGGLDSSLVAAIASEYLRSFDKRLITFSIGMSEGTDLAYAKKVAKHINSQHFEVVFTPEEGVRAIDEVIKCCETYDITTIRASVGQYLLAKWISTNMPKIKVILNGDGADEIQMGYIYYYKAPNSIDAALDSQRLTKEIHFFDGLRVDRNISNHGLEARVPFLDKDFINLYENIPPKFKVPSYKNCEKYLIRKSFEEVYKAKPILPSDILWRRKEAFSDGVSSKEKSWFQIIQEHIATQNYNKNLDYNINPPYTDESSYYRYRFTQIFGPNVSNIIPHFWLPNWTDEKDPSARKLDIY